MEREGKSGRERGGERKREGERGGERGKKKAKEIKIKKERNLGERPLLGTRWAIANGITIRGHLGTSHEKDQAPMGCFPSEV